LIFDAGRPPTKKIYPKPIDEIIYQLQGLNLSEGSNKLVGQEQNAVVVYRGDGALVPYAGAEFMKRRKPRPKVDLDPESNRIWNLLMGKEESKGVEGTDKEKEKWWEEERKVFRGRTDSFIARMHLIQGTVPLTILASHSDHHQVFCNSYLFYSQMTSS
jgi:hypothetical protein